MFVSFELAKNENPWEFTSYPLPLPMVFFIVESSPPESLFGLKSGGLYGLAKLYKLSKSYAFIIYRSFYSAFIRISFPLPNENL